MSEQHMEIARGGFATYNRRGIRAVAEEYWHPEVEWQVGPWGVALGGQTHLHGREQAIAAFHELEAIMGKFKTEVLDVIEGPDGVLVDVRAYGRGRGSGAVVDQRFWYAIEVEEGLERRIRVFGDRAEALEAVGLGERG